MRHGFRHRGGSTAAVLRVVLALLSSAALVCGGDGLTGAPVSLRSSGRAQPPSPAPLHAPASLSIGLGPQSAGSAPQSAGSGPQSVGSGPQATVPSAYSMSMAARIGTRQVKASWTYVDGLPGLNAQLDSWLLGVLDAAAASEGTRYRPTMALNTAQPGGQAPATTLTAEPVQAYGTVIAVRETVKNTAADGARTASTAIVFADTGTGEVHGAADLLRPDAVAGIRSKVTGTPVDIARPSPEDTALSDMVLDPEGELQVTSAEPATGNPSGDRETSTIDAQDTGSALSDFGRKVLGQVTSKATVALPQPSAPALRHVNCDLVPCAALTYDDGPDAKTTPQLLGILKEKNAQATFFMLGSNASANPATARQVSDSGHAIGNHTFSHPYLTKLSTAGVRNEIDRTESAIRAATGTAPVFMRPPYGAANAAVQSAVGMPLILWAVDSLDWQSKNPAVFVPKVLKEITPGAVVIMHDVHPTTIAGQAELITALQTQGYHLVTVPQLFEGVPLGAGQVYRSRPERR